eukprot:scaffold10735_cov14-Tisochrysis_lutea.AAC.1
MHLQHAQPLVRVPRALMMTEDSALRQDYGKLAKDGGFTEWQCMRLVLAGQLWRLLKGMLAH